jgi:hypothetical protein
MSQKDRIAKVSQRAVSKFYDTGRGTVACGARTNVDEAQLLVVRRSELPVIPKHDYSGSTFHYWTLLRGNSYGTKKIYLARAIGFLNNSFPRCAVRAIGHRLDLGK